MENHPVHFEGEDGLSMVSSTGTPEAEKKSLVITSLCGNSPSRPR
jgi:hypothetical protein